MKVTHTYDIYNRTEPSTIYLSKPGKRILCALNGIDTSTASLTLNTNNTAELSFTVNKYIDENIISNGYDELDEMMELYCDGIWFKIADPPQESNDGIQETKDITAESYEIMLSQFSLNNFNINTGEKDSYEVMYKTTHKDYLIDKLKKSHEEEYRKNHPDATEEEIKADLKDYDVEDDWENNLFYQVKFCYSDDEIKTDSTLEDLSLLHLTLKHSGADIAGWTVGYIDPVTNDDFDKDPYDENSTIPYSERNILPNYVTNYEVDDKSVYTFLTQDVAQACRCVFEFDTVNMKINAYRPETLGIDTGIFLGFRNIQNNVTTSRDDALITQFYVEGLDDYDIASANFSTNWISDLSYFEREPYMNTTLVEKYQAFKKYREEQRLNFVRYSQCYNAINEKLTELVNRVPTDSAQTTWTDCDMDTLQSAYTSNSAILSGLEALYVDKDNNFDLSELKKCKEDWNLYQSIKNYTLPEITAAMQYLMDNHQYTEDEMKDWKFQPYSSGTGNILSNPNPIVLNTEWEMINPEYGDRFELFDISDSSLPNGITRAVHLIPKTMLDNPDRGRFGLSQKKVSIELGQTYILSCYMIYDTPISNGFRGDFQLQCANIGGEFVDLKADVDEQSTNWQLVKAVIETGSEKTFNKNMIDIAFTTQLGARICGMQLERYNGDLEQVNNFKPTFGYYIQPETVLKAYETDWKLYGIDELKVKINTYQNCIDELKKSGFGEGYSYISDAGYKEEYGYQMHQNYLDYLNLKTQAEIALKQRQAEYDCINEGKLPEDINFEFTITDPYIIKVKDLDKSGNPKYDGNNEITYLNIDIKDFGGLTGYSEKRSKLVDDVSINNWGIDGYENTSSGAIALTDEEKRIIQHLCRQASYSNENIVLTSIDDTSTAVEKSFKLLNDAKDQLYIESHPQYTYSDTIENIYALPEFKLYHDKLNVNDYIYLGLDDETYVKLRVIKIQYNPMDLDEQMDITFSNSIQYKSKRVDFNNLLNTALNQSNHDGGSVQGVQKNADSSSYILSADIVQRLFSNPFFSSKISNTTTSNTGSAAQVNIDSVISQLLNSPKDKFSNLNNQSGFIQALESNYLTSDFIGMKFITAKNISSLFAGNNLKDITISNTTIDTVKLLNSTFNSISGNEILSASYKINPEDPIEFIKSAVNDTSKYIQFVLNDLLDPVIELTTYIENGETKSNIEIEATDINLTGNISLSTISNINSISTTAADKIKECHTHTEISDLYQKINELQSQIDELKKALPSTNE